MRVPLKLRPHPQANEEEHWSLMFLIGKAIEADTDELRLRFVERVHSLNASIDRRLERETPIMWVV